MKKNKQVPLSITILLMLALFLLILYVLVFKEEGKKIISDSKPISSIDFSMFFNKKEIMLYSTDVKRGLIGKIRDIEVDEDGNIFLLDISDHNIKKFDSQGKHLLTIGRKGQGPGEMSFIHPFTKLEVWEDKLYVIDTGNLEIDIFNKKKGSFLNSFKIDFNKVMEFVVLNGNIFLLSYRLSDGKIIHQYNSTGDHILSFGYTGLNESESQRIAFYSYYCAGSIDHDEEGKIYYAPQYYLSNNVFSEKKKLIIIFSRKNSFFRTPNLNDKYYDSKLPLVEKMKVVNDKFIFNIRLCPKVTGNIKSMHRKLSI